MGEEKAHPVSSKWFDFALTKPENGLGKINNTLKRLIWLTDLE